MTIKYFINKQKTILFYVWLLASLFYVLEILHTKNFNICTLIYENTEPNFVFRSKNGEIISKNLMFSNDGLIKGNSSPNEYQWKCIYGHLNVYNKDGQYTSSFEQPELQIGGDLLFWNQLNMLGLQHSVNIFIQILNYFLLGIITIIPFLFFTKLKSIKLKCAIFGAIILICIGYYSYEFSSNLIFQRDSPSLFRLIEISMISGIIISLSRGSEKKFNITDIYLITYGIAALIWVCFLKNSFWFNPEVGKHWFYTAYNLLHGSSFMGTSFFTDSFLFDGKYYIPYSYGSIIFPYVFGAYIRIGTIIVVISTVYLYLRLYKFVVPTEWRRLTVAIMISIVLLPAIIMSASFYPYTELGGTLFFAAALLYYFQYKQNNQNHQMIFASILFIISASFFRSEIILTMIPILLYELYAHRKLRYIVPFCMTGIAIIALYSFQNYVKYGLLLNKNKVSSMFSLENFIQYFPGYFYNTPDLSLQNFSFLKFKFNGTEPGGYFTIKYIGFLIGFCCWIFPYVTNLIRQKLLNSDQNVRHNRDIDTNGLLCLSIGLLMLLFYPLYVNTSQRYDFIYAPLLIISGVYFLPKSKIINVLLLLFFIWIHIAVTLSFLDTYQWMS